MSFSILDQIVARKKKRVEGLKESMPLEMLIEYNRLNKKSRKGNFKGALKNRDRISIIAEVKKASPSAGVIREDFDPVSIIKTYDSMPVDAVSVITEEDFFKGSIETLALVERLSDKPALMKDFIIDEYQLHDALRWDADCVLLIAKILAPELLEEFISKSKRLGLDSLVEVHSRSELDAAVSAGAEIVGINNRNLETFEVDIETTINLIDHVPEHIVRVSESGVRTGDDIKRLFASGVDAVLIGEVLMRSKDISLKLRELLGHD